MSNLHGIACCVVVGLATIQAWSCSLVSRVIRSDVCRWEGVGRRLPTISDLGEGSFFLPGNDSSCVHTHSAAAGREGEMWGGVLPAVLELN